METTYRMAESPTTGQLEPVSPWKTKRFQILAASAVGMGLFLSICGVFTLKANVDELKNEKLPVIQQKIDTVQLP